MASISFHADFNILLSYLGSQSTLLTFFYWITNQLIPFLSENDLLLIPHDFWINSERQMTSRLKWNFSLLENESSNFWITSLLPSVLSLLCMPLNLCMLRYYLQKYHFHSIVWFIDIISELNEINESSASF